MRVIVENRPELLFLDVDMPGTTPTETETNAVGREPVEPVTLAAQ